MPGLAVRSMMGNAARQKMEREYDQRLVVTAYRDAIGLYCGNKP